MVFVKYKSHEGIGDQCFMQWENGVNQGLHETLFRKIKKYKVAMHKPRCSLVYGMLLEITQKDIYKAIKLKWTQGGKLP